MSCATSWSSGSSPPTASTPRSRRRASARHSASRAAELPGATALQIEISGGIRSRAERAAEAALRAAGVDDGHLAIAFVDAAEMRDLNREHRGRDEPTDVLAFPIDGAGGAVGPRELGDVIVCPEHAEDLDEVVVHGVLHLCGHDHEADGGQMLELQRRVLAELR